MSRSIFALVDCNNFYASCERLFKPWLIGKPLVVLSNNDGCLISRSDEAKALGIPMGAPYFKIKPLIEASGVRVFSSNYPLYGNISERVQDLLEEICPRVEAYSIDEWFLSLPDFPETALETFARDLRVKILTSTGMPVSIGIGESKTLAKLANYLAKKTSETDGTLCLTTCNKKQSALEKTDLKYLWGIGSGSVQKLEKLEVRTAQNFYNLPPALVRKVLGVTGLRTHQELHGLPCLQLEDYPEDRKSVLVSRSFGSVVTKREELDEAVSVFSKLAAQKLHRGKMVCSTVSVFLRTNRHKPGDQQYRPNIVISLPTANRSTGEITKAALAGIKEIFKEGYHYKKAGLFLLDLQNEKLVQNSLFSPRDTKSENLSCALDLIDRDFGNAAIHYGTRDHYACWKMNQNLRSQSYTTQWSDLLQVKG
ncbi:Y-family DNA polymerase [Kiloniella laminariae]|uniref:DNA-directed DNA polymerase n=1 Tax=Kiloniella laminariae TaxID=454162 RepID=A0ABT4LLV0_9PROT|nr:Y-family DNA polymerase [Kiloniella laminariae]MCZ4282082.1 Y-family DNA polymerase [Kiloniella laminariae]